MADRRVLFLGDSFVAGTGDPGALGWVGRVTAAAWAAGLPLTAYPLGVRRETSVDVAARWRAEARPRLVDGADCRVVLAFGANDTTIEDGARRVEPAASVRALGAMLAGAAALGLPAFVVGPAPVGDARRHARAAALCGAFAEECARHGVPYVPVAEALGASAPWREEAAAGDGAHPGAGGYAALAALVLAAGWLDWLRDPR